MRQSGIDVSAEAEWAAERAQRVSEYAEAKAVAIRDVLNGLAVLEISRVTVAYPDGQRVPFQGLEAQEAARRVLCRGPTPALPLPAHAVR